jgi:invasion protein IalB
MFPRPAKLFAAASLVLALACHESQAQSEIGSGQVKAVYGAWKLKCAQLSGAKREKCALVQDLALEDRKNMFMTVILLRSFEGGDKRILRVVAPLRMLLPPGLGLKVDGADVGHVPFIKCFHEGCVAEVVIDDQLVSKFSTGRTASFIVFPTQETGVGFPAPLAGFAEGMKGLN